MRTKYDEFFFIFFIISNKINCNQKNNDQIWMKNKLKNCFKKFKGVNQGEEKKNNIYHRWQTGGMLTTHAIQE
jgi:hypothetical protein